MRIFGVLNASPDSLHQASIVGSPEEAVRRARELLEAGADALDLGGQGSTDQATVVPAEDEWARVQHIVPALAALGTDLSIDTWRPEVARRALDAGATHLNAADGMQSPAMWEVAAEFQPPIVLPFLSGPNPRAMELVRGDPVQRIIEFFQARLGVADRYGLRSHCILDPGTGFAPPSWPWEERFVYQKEVYGRLHELRVFDLPLYVALPWKDTPQHAELLDLVVRQRPEYGRAHYPARVRAAERAAGILHGDSAP